VNDGLDIPSDTLADLREDIAILKTGTANLTPIGEGDLDEK